MKLYTEEQLRKAIERGYSAAISEDSTTTEIANNFIKLLTPIQLPSDEEIEHKIDNRLDKEFLVCCSAFRHGAKWMRDKIQGGNK